MKKEKEIKKEEKKTVWYKEVIAYLSIIAIVIVIRTFIFTPAVVDGPSMEPTLKSNNWLIVLKFTKIDRNDVIVFKYNSEAKETNESKGDLLCPILLPTIGLNGYLV